MLSLLSKYVLEGAGWLYSTAGLYAFNELFCFSNVNCALFDVCIVCDEWWLHNVFKDAGCESFKEGDRLSISYSVTSLSS